MRKTFLARRCVAALLTLALVISLAPAVFAVDPTITVSPPSGIELEQGGTETLTATVTTNPGETASVTWTSSDNAIATVSGSGMTATVRGVKTGTAGITATATVTTTDATSGATTTKTGTATVSVTVLPKVTLSKSSSNLDIGKTEALKAYVDGKETSTGITWSSDDETVATVKTDGTVTAVGGGTARITATYADAGITVVSSPYTVTVKPLEITVEPSDVSFIAGIPQKMKARVNYDRNALGGRWKFKWSKGVTVTKGNYDGRECAFTVVADQEIDISQWFEVCYYYTIDSKTYTKTVLVDNLGVKFPEIKFDPESINLALGGEQKLTASLVGAEMADPEWAWSVTRGENTVVTIEENQNDKGIVTVKAVGRGEAHIRVAYKSESKEVTNKTCIVTVKPFEAPTVTITPTPGGEELTEGQELTLKAAANPEMTGGWEWTVEPANPDAIEYDSTNMKTDTLKITATEYSKDHKNDITVTAKFKLTGSAAAGAAAADEKNEYTATYRFLVKEADYTLELDKTSLDFDLLKANHQYVTATLTKGGKAQGGKKIIFDKEVKDDDGNIIARVEGNDTTDASGQVALKVTPVGTGSGDFEIRYDLDQTGGFTPSVKKTCKVTVTGPSIRVNPPTLELNTYEKNMAELNAVLTGAGAVDSRNIKWVALKEDGITPSDVVRITYDQGGLCRIEAIKDGKAIVKASYELKGEVSGTISAECAVTVGTYSLTINPSGEVRKEPGETTTVSATVKKIGLNDVTVPNHEKNLSWQISDGTIARFDTASGPLQKNGVRQVKVVGVPGKTGTVTVTARWEYKGNSAEEALTIVFGAPEPESLNFTVSPSTLTLEGGAEGKLSASKPTIKWKDGKTRPAPADFAPTFAWKSSDPKVATVDKDGKVTAISAGEAVITATAKATVNGVEITGEKTAKVTVTVSTKVKSIKITKPSNGSMSMEAGTRETVTVVVDPEGTPYAWTSSDEKVARVEGNTVIAVKPGKATLTVTAGGQSAKLEVTVNGLDQLQDEITVIEGKSVDVGTLFKAYGAAEGKTPTYSPQDPNIASYNSGRIMGNSVGSTSITASVGTYRISFKVNVVADETSTISLPTMYTQTQKTLPFRDFLDRFRAQADGALTHIVGLSVDPAKGTLYYNYSANGESGSGVGAGSYYLSPGTGQRGIAEVTFVPRMNYSGQVVINYTAVTKDNKNVACRIVFDVDPGDGSSAGLFLKTDYNTPLRFRGDDFNRVCRERLGAQLDYVTFSQPSERTGTLYTDYAGVGNYGSVVDPRTHYSRNALDDVWFVPAPGFSGTATVYYTAYAVGGGSFAGQMDITVGVEDGVTISGLAYDISRGGVARFDDADFNRYCRQVLDFGQTVNYVRFDRLPSESEGVLWYDYTSSSDPGSRASTGTSYYYGTRTPRIDWLTFVPASGYTGTIKIPFTGWTTDGDRFTGTVEVNVRGGGTAGDILYICGAGETVRFDDTDFNALSRDITNSSLNYIQFTSLPSGSSGSVYYNNSRASTSTRYRNGSSTPRIDNLSFRASSSFAGAVDIPFEGRSTSGESFRGVVTVATSADAAGSGSTTGASQTIFTDMAGYSDSQKAAVNYLYDHNITRGMTTTQFGPQNSIRRGDFARMLYQAFDLAPVASTKVFTDVPSNAYYAQAVNALHSRGIVSGIGGGLYAPNDTLTRQDAICMVQRAMRSVGWSADDGAASTLYRYSDGGSVAGYAQGAMSFAVQRGILPTGGSWLNPTQPLTRVDMAEIIYRVLAG